MINKKLVINSWVGIHAGCDIAYKIHDSTGVYVTLSGDAEPFEFFFDIEALRDFLTQGNATLVEMDALAIQEAVEQVAEQSPGSPDYRC